MRIEKIELIGFKSFADKTVFNLHQGITCIVGPNGCGKSNVVDAFKWVLGEQSAKSLRGDKMEEVIFSGSQTKKPRGMADVTLSVTGLGNPGDDSQLTAVTRRLYRSGDSEYMLNRDVCRLRDVRDIFLDTGLEVKSYSILEQDRIAAVLNAKPEDRRFLIEEVAGVVKYKVRRAEAQSKLASSRLNLQRVTDVIAEVKRQINSLDRQVKKAERYKRLMEEMRLIELRLAKRDYSSLKDSLAGIIGEYTALKEEDASLRAEMTNIEADLETRKLALLDREKRLGARQEELRSKEMDIADLERTVAVLNTDRDNLKEYITKLKFQEEEVRNKTTEAEGKKEGMEASKSALLVNLDSLNDELMMKNESLGIKEDELSEKEGLLDAKRKELFMASEELSLQRNELRMQARFLENLNKKQDSAALEYDETKDSMEEARSALKTIEALGIEKKNEALGLSGRKESLEKEMTGHKEKLDESRVSLSESREELASDTSRLESLKEMVSGGEPSLEILSRLGGRGTSVSEAIEVPAEYEKAVEAALREAAGGLILPGLGDVEAAAAMLREKDAERTALIPLDTGRQRTEKGLPEGTLGFASELIRVKDEYLRIIKNMLCNVVVVNDLKAAFEAADPEMTYVTLEGDMVEPSGAVIAGRGKGILRMKRQIREVESGAEALRARILSISGEMEAASANIRETEEALRAAAAEMLGNDRELHELGLKSERGFEEIERIERKLQNLRMEMEETAKEKDTLLKAIADKETVLKEAEEGARIIEEEITGLQERLAEEKAGYEEQRSKTVDIRLSINSCRERMDSLDKEFDALSTLQAELKEKTGFIGEEFSLSEARVRQKEEQIMEKDGVLKEHVLKANELGGAIASERDAMAAESALASASEERLKALRAKMEPCSRRLSELEVAKAEHKLRMENLAGNIKNNYAVELEALQLEPPAPEDEERLEVLRGKIQELGTVSLGSIEEYEELRGRYEFLTKQQDDIEQSIAELEEAITKINATTRKRLRDAYEALNLKFAEVFILLFGGGRAELRMTDENNILETGIDISVQPPGKRLQNINLLSGGEKTLTVLSLLFASFLIKPTPLCILDEADASLDESNTEKFSRMLKDLSRDTQFIVITHNKVTMEASDYIYGITMEEAGVSKVISLQFADAGPVLNPSAGFATP
ncbi:MAG: chromosome segregation protein SMC [Thermodesulfovibrionales bacterium]|nr:chromosome segregation protein SMC [Thermodesulfovibrionales bacterium]